MVVHVCTTVFCGWFCSKGEKVKNSEIKSEREREVWEIWLLFNKYDSLGVLTHLHQKKIDSSLTARKGHLPSYVDWYFPLRADFSQTEITFCFHVPRWGWRSFHPTEVCLCHWNFWYYFCLLSSVSYERLNELLCPLSLIKVWFTTKSTWRLIKPQEYRNIHSPSHPSLFNKANKPQNTI